MLPCKSWRQSPVVLLGHLPHLPSPPQVLELLGQASCTLYWSWSANASLLPTPHPHPLPQPPLGKAESGVWTSQVWAEKLGAVSPPWGGCSDLALRLRAAGFPAVSFQFTGLDVKEHIGALAQGHRRVVGSHLGIVYLEPPAGRDSDRAEVVAAVAGASGVEQHGVETVQQWACAASQDR